jgi:hypothetical protein
VATYAVPLSGTGSLWDVFSLNGATLALTPVNVIRTAPGPNGVGSASSRIPLPGAAQNSASATTDEDLQRIANDVAREPKPPQ